MTFTQVTFDKDYLPSILCHEVESLQDCWIGLEYWENSLIAEDSELEAIHKFISCLGKGAIEDDSKLIKLVFNGDGTIKDFYGPALFKKESPEAPAELIILFGENHIPCQFLDNGYFQAGELVGALAEREINDKQYPCIQFVSSDDQWEFTLPLRTIEKECSKAELRPLIRRQTEFLEKIMSIPKDRGNFINLPELGACEIQVKAFEYHDSKYGPRYYMELDHGIFTRANKALSEYLAKSPKILALAEAGKPLALKISEISTTQSGHLGCKAMVYPRMPKPELEYSFLKSQELAPAESPAPAMPAKIMPVVNVKEKEVIPF